MAQRPVIGGRPEDHAADPRDECDGPGRADPFAEAAALAVPGLADGDRVVTHRDRAEPAELGASTATPALVWIDRGGLATLERGRVDLPRPKEELEVGGLDIAVGEDLHRVVEGREAGRHHGLAGPALAAGDDEFIPTPSLIWWSVP